jgi:D-sedoheptulose 7-phosphate isomerase
VGRPQDVALGISPSGNCPNVLRGLRQAKAIGLQTAGLTGGTGGQMQGVCDVLIVVPATATATASARIQEMHGMIGHMLCRALEMRLGPWSRIYPDADPIHSAAPQKERHHVDSRLCPAGYR